MQDFFPYGNGEPYLETEVKYYEQYFDRIYICSLQLRKEIYNLDENYLQINLKYSQLKKHLTMFIYLTHLEFLGNANLYKELWKLGKEKRMSFQRVVRLFVYLSRSYYEAGKIKKWFKRKVTFDNLDCRVLYSLPF